MKIIEVITKRKDTLLGCWYGEQYRDTCVIITNGTGGNIFENRFLRVLGDELEKENISYIFNTEKLIRPYYSIDQKNE